MKQKKIDLTPPKVKVFVTSGDKAIQNKKKGNDGGYTWVG